VGAALVNQVHERHRYGVEKATAILERAATDLETNDPATVTEVRAALGEILGNNG
jgi:hypothetical protein